jgi:hypothetical protein
MSGATPLFPIRLQGVVFKRTRYVFIASCLKRQPYLYLKETGCKAVRWRELAWGRACLMTDLLKKCGLTFGFYYQPAGRRKTSSGIWAIRRNITTPVISISHICFPCHKASNTHFSTFFAMNTIWLSPPPSWIVVGALQTVRYHFLTWGQHTRYYRTEGRPWILFGEQKCLIVRIEFLVP